MGETEVWRGFTQEVEALGLCPSWSMLELLLLIQALPCSGLNRTFFPESICLDTANPCLLLLSLGIHAWLTPFCSHNFVLIRCESKVLMPTVQAIVMPQLCIL